MTSKELLDLGGLGVDVFSSLMGYDAQKQANQQNLDIMHMQNEFNEKMLDKQLAYNTEMWERQNDYNSPKAQMQRLKDAGLSPFRMMQTGSTGNAGAVNGITPPTSAGATMNPETISFDNASRRLSELSAQKHSSKMAEADTALKWEQLNGIKIDNKWKESRIIRDLAETASRTHNFDADTALKKALADFERSSKGIRLANLSATNYQMNAQTALFRVQKAIVDKELKYIDERQQVEIANIMDDSALKLAQAYAAYQAGHLSKKQAEKVKEDIELVKQSTKKLIAEITGVDNANKLFDETWHYVVQRAELDSIPRTAEERVYSTSWWHPKYGEAARAVDYAAVHNPIGVKLK